MRALPTPPSASPKASSAPISRTFEVCTPVFGGGVFIDKKRGYEKPIDTLTPVRVSAIIGQLRFWWRAIEGINYPTLNTLREAEGRLWGTAIKPGVASVWLTGKVETKETQRFRNTKDNPLSTYRYGVFPLENTDDRKEAGGWLTNLTGEVTLSVGLAPKATEDDRALVALVLDAWLHFGGVGGRTRRGFGAVAPTKGCGWSHDLEGLLRRVKARAQTSTPTFHPMMPTLHHPKGLAPHRLISGLGNAQGAHTLLLGKLNSFRQLPDVGRRHGQQNRPGRSYWPDADEIRRLTGRAAYRHSPISKARGFAKARFGMPVITQFKDSKEGDPENSTLTPKGEERMASPLILRPLGHGSSYASLALYLYVPQLEQLELTLEHQRNKHDARLRISGDVSDIKPMRENGPHQDDPILAFLNFLHQ